MVSSTLRLASSSLLRSAARSSSVALPRVAALAPSSRLVAPAATAAFKVAPVTLGNAVRGYASGSGLSHQEIQNRIVEVLKSFEKVDPAKVSRRQFRNRKE
jgi:NADH dehydrogenase (ubiquinone) 1 alpha/beta subcomplex 1